MLSNGVQQLDNFRKDPAPLIKYATGSEFDSRKTELAQEVFRNYFTNISLFNPNSLEEVCTSIQFVVNKKEKLK